MIRRDAQPRRRLPACAALGLVLGLAALPAGARLAAADEAVQTRAALIDGGARVVFDWPAPVAFTTTVSGNRVTIGFERPLAATFDGVLQALPDRVRAMDIADNGLSVVLTLAEPSHVNAFAQGDLVVVDLRPTAGEAPTAVAQVPDPAPAPAPDVPQAAEQTAAAAPAGAAGPAAAEPSAAAVPPAPEIVDGVLSVRYGLHDAYDRIVFDWPERVPYTVDNNGGLIEIRFQASARINSEALAARFPSRLRLVSAETGPDSLVVVIAAPPGARVQDFYNLTKTVIDIYRDPSGAAPVSPPARPDQVATAEPETPEPEVSGPEASGPAEAEAVEPPAEQVEAAPELAAEPELVAPEAPAEAADAHPEAPAAPVEPPTVTGGNAAVLATLPPSPGLTRRPGMPAAAGTEAAEEPDPAVEATPEPEVVEPETPAVAEAAPSEAHPPAAEAEPEPTTRSAATEPEAASEPAAEPEAAEAAPGPATVDVVVIDGDFEALMRLRWSQPVRAAVVKRGDRIWIAFDQAVAAFDLAAIEGGAGPIYDAPELFATEGGLAFSVRVGEEVEPRVSAAGNTWYVQIRPRRSETTAALAVERFEDPVLGPAVAFTSAAPPLDPGEPIAVTDPEIGDRLVVVPIGAAGAGLPEEATFVQFHAVATAQGLAFDRLSDDVVVRSRDGRVEVVASGGLSLSDDQAARAAAGPDHAATEPAHDDPHADPAAADEHASAEDPHATPDDPHTAPQAAHAEPAEVAEATVPVAPRGGVLGDFRLFDQEPWRLEDQGRFGAVNRQLQAATSQAHGNASRAEARVRFARFLFGHNQFRDAGGMLRLIGVDTPGLFDADPSLIGLRGATAFMNGEIDDAVIDLSDRRLQPSGEAQYWRAAALAAQGHHAQAEAIYAGSATVPDWYDDELRIPLALASVDTALAVGNVERAAEVLDTLPYFGLAPRPAGEIALRRADAAWASGDTDAAEEAWEDAIGSGIGGIAARAVVDRTTALYAAGTLSPEEAAAALDSVRYDWRGGRFELSLLRQLAEYQFAAGDYRSGLRTLKQARALFTADADRVEVDSRLQTAFAELFGPQPPANVSPVTSIALFSEFEELAPEGALRDEMLRRLAGRLVAIDLYDEAAKVLHTLLLDDLLGPARGELGRDLAVLYLAAGEPQAAIDALLATRSRDFSDELNEQRRHLRASAHLALDDVPAALTALEEDNSQSADMLRAEIHWRQGDWTAAAGAFGRLAEGPEFVWPPLPEPVPAATGEGMAAADGAPAEAMPALPSAAEAASLDAPAADAAPMPDRAGWSARIAPLGDFAAEQVLNWAMALTYADDQDGLDYLRQRYGGVMAGTAYGDMFRLLVADDIGPIESVADLGRIGNSIDMFEQFLAGYRERLADELADPAPAAESAGDAGADAGAPAQPAAG